jgi:hypothetical protein
MRHPSVGGAPLGVETGTVFAAVPFSWPKVFATRCGRKDARVKELGQAAGIVGIESVGKGAFDCTAVDKLGYTGSYSTATVGPARVGVHSTEAHWCGEAAKGDVGRFVDQAIREEVEL